MTNPKITIFTPTFNRKNLLKKCYESLKNQTDKNFIWLIVDDGSTDNTNEFIKLIKESSDFTIDYYYQCNGGKCKAFNYAVELCNTDYFLVLDSDDTLSNNAIEVLNKKILEIDNNHLVSGIIGNTFDNEKNRINGTRVPNLKFVTGLELYQKYGFKGDTLRMYKTKILRKNLFPLVPEEKFIPENVIFDKIDCNYKMLVIDELLYLCIYQDNGYSKNINVIRHSNPIGYSYSLKSAAETAIVLRKKINWTLLYIIWCKNFNIHGYQTFCHKIRYIFLYPFALILNALKLPRFLFESIEIRDVK